MNNKYRLLDTQFHLIASWLQFASSARCSSLLPRTVGRSTASLQVLHQVLLFNLNCFQITFRASKHWRFWFFFIHVTKIPARRPVCRERSKLSLSLSFAQLIRACSWSFALTFVSVHDLASIEIYSTLRGGLMLTLKCALVALGSFSLQH